MTIARKKVTENHNHNNNNCWKTIRFLPFVFALMLFLGACSSVDCPLNSKVMCAYNYVKPDGTPDTLKDTFTVTALKWADDTIVFNRGVNLSYFSVPMSNTEPEDVLLFCFKDTSSNMVYDTVWVEKLNYPHLESVDCNPKFFHTITKVRSTHNRIENIVINDNKVEYESKENIHIHLSPYF